MIFDLVGDFTETVASMPREHSRIGRLLLLEEAIRRDIHFIDRHPTTIFQCLWNSCWWYDCSEAAKHFNVFDSAATEFLPWEFPIRQRLANLLESWLEEKDKVTSGFIWLRMQRPPSLQLGLGQKRIFRGHEGGVNSVAWSSDGRCIASGSDDGTVRVWDPTCGVQVSCIHGHESRVRCVAWSDDGQRLVSGTDRKLRIWDAHNGHELFSLSSIEIGLRSVAWRANRLVAGGEFGLLLWDTTSDQIVIALSQDELGFNKSHCTVINSRHGFSCYLCGHEGGVNSVAWSSDGRQFVSGGDDGSVRIWDANEVKEVLCLDSREEHVWSVAWSSDGRHVVSGSFEFLVQSSNSSVRIWDTMGDGESVNICNDERLVRSVAWSKDQRHIAIALGNVVQVLDVSTHRVGFVRELESWVNTVVWNDDGRHIATGSHDGSVRVWDTACRQRALSLHDRLQIEHIEDAHNRGRSIKSLRRLPFRAKRDSIESFVYESRLGDELPIAWLPDPLASIHEFLSGRAWLGFNGDYASVFTLEGELAFADPN